jgi:phosphatidylglycerophosphatase A
MSKSKDNMVLFIAQGAYSGRFPKAPGTAGTVIGALLYLLIKDASPLVYGAVCVCLIALGTWAAGRADTILGTKDSPTIVIDEVAGFLVAMMLVPFTWWSVPAVFVLFRFFDILKPWPIDRLQSIPGGPGVMLDDIVAGIYANLLFRLAWVNFGP